MASSGQERNSRPSRGATVISPRRTRSSRAQSRDAMLEQDHERAERKRKRNRGRGGAGGSGKRPKYVDQNNQTDFGADSASSSVMSARLEAIKSKPNYCSKCCALKYPETGEVEACDRVCRHDLRRIGPYIVGPRLTSHSIQAVMGNNHMKSIQQNVVRREGTNRFYCSKMLTVRHSEEETPDDRQGKVLLENERSILSLLSGERGVVQLADVIKDEVLERYSPYSLSCPARAVRYTGVTERRFSLILECLVAHDFDPGSLNNVNLQYYVIKGQKLGETKALHVFLSLMDTLRRLHDLNIVHRDVKLGSVVLDLTSGNTKLINFGYAKHLMASNQLLTDQCGSPAYISPELVSGDPYKGKPSDVWSAGVVFYTMLFGTFPFYDRSPANLFRLIKAGQYYVPVEPSISPATLELLQGMLLRDPLRRMTAEQVCQKILACGPIQTNMAFMRVVPDINDESTLQDQSVPSVADTPGLQESPPESYAVPGSSTAAPARGASNPPQNPPSSFRSSGPGPPPPSHNLPSFRSQFFRTPRTGAPGPVGTEGSNSSPLLNHSTTTVGSQLSAMGGTGERERPSSSLPDPLSSTRPSTRVLALMVRRNVSSMIAEVLSQSARAPSVSVATTQTTASPPVPPPPAAETPTPRSGPPPSSTVSVTRSRSASTHGPGSGCRVQSSQGPRITSSSALYLASPATSGEGASTSAEPPAPPPTRTSSPNPPAPSLPNRSNTDAVPVSSAPSSGPSLRFRQPFVPRPTFTRSSAQGAAFRFFNASPPQRPSRMLVTRIGRDARHLSTPNEVRDLFFNQFRQHANAFGLGSAFVRSVLGQNRSTAVQDPSDYAVVPDQVAEQETSSVPAGGIVAPGVNLRQEVPSVVTPQVPGASASSSASSSSAPTQQRQTNGDAAASARGDASSQAPCGCGPGACRSRLCAYVRHPTAQPQTRRVIGITRSSASTQVNRVEQIRPATNSLEGVGVSGAQAGSEHGPAEPNAANVSAVGNAVSRPRVRLVGNLRSNAEATQISSRLIAARDADVVTLDATPGTDESAR